MAPTPLNTPNDPQAMIAHAVDERFSGDMLMKWQDGKVMQVEVTEKLRFAEQVKRWLKSRLR